MSEPAPHVVGVVPCAGASRRMGASKALLELEGRTFVARVVAALRDGGCASVLVVVRAGAEEEAEAARDAGAVVLENPEPGEGPITSLRLALERLPPDTDAVAFCPVDHPLLRPAAVASLLSALADHGPPLVVPVYGGERGHPGIFGRELFGELADPGLEGGARTVVRRHLDAARSVEVDDPGVVADIDTPEGYRRVVADEGDGEPAGRRSSTP